MSTNPSQQRPGRALGPSAAFLCSPLGALRRAVCGLQPGGGGEGGCWEQPHHVLSGKPAGTEKPWLWEETEKRKHLRQAMRRRGSGAFPSLPHLRASPGRAAPRRALRRVCMNAEGHPSRAKRRLGGRLGTWRECWVLVLLVLPSGYSPSPACTRATPDPESEIEMWMLHPRLPPRVITKVWKNNKGRRIAQSLENDSDLGWQRKSTGPRLPFLWLNWIREAAGLSSAAWFSH